MYKLDIKPGLFFKDVEHIVDINLAHTSFSVCILFVALSPYVSMGTVACLGQLPAIDNGWNRLGSDHHCEKHTSISVFCWPMRVGIQFGLCPFCTWNEVPRERSTSFVDSYWVSWQFLAVLHLLLNSSQIHFVLWQFWTIICMVFRTILILHSLTQCCVVSCFLWVFLSNLAIQILCI